MRLLLALLLLASCATPPTPYQKEKKKEGYSDAMLNDLRVSVFKANSVSKPDRAQRYAEFHAIANCRAENKHANIMDIADQSVRKDVTRTSGNTWGPSYGFGMYPYYSRYSNFGFGVGWNTMSGSSWQETLVYPIMEVYYNCSEKILRPQVAFREISAEQMKLLVKDLKGALQIERIMEKSPNERFFEAGDLILKANGKRIEKVYELIRLFDGSNSSIKVEFMREGERKSGIMKAVDVTEEIVKAENELIRKTCDDKKGKKQKELTKHPLCQ